MYFKKLEIFGFKSFAEKTVLIFEPGITAVVGPNGCGKSNIFDSIRWALGEQSIKSLRGSKSEDVIFNGTEKIPALNLAEVSVTFSNETKFLPVDYEEVTITRRLYRSGESDYLLNNNPVRLKDINEMLMGTGIGAESYSLVQQGKIDLVLSSRPEDRRLVFDEATGVSKYKMKKKEALRKLEETNNNLLRVNDIILEVKRQIASIERQASKARRYKEVFEKLKILETRVARHEYEELKLQTKQLEETEVKRREDVARLESELADISKQAHSLQEEINVLNQENFQLRNEFTNDQNIIERNKQRIQMNQERILELSKRIESIESQKVTLAQRIEHDEQSAASIRTSLSEIDTVCQTKQAIFQEKEHLLKDLEQKIQKARDQINHANSSKFDLAAKSTKINNELIDIASSLNNFTARKRRVEVETLKTKEEKERSQSELSTIQEQTELVRNQFLAAKTHLDSLQTTFNRIQKDIDALNAEITTLHETQISLQSQKEFLEQLQLKYETMPTGKEAQLLIKDVKIDNEKELSGIIAKAKSVSFDARTNTYSIACEAKFFSLDIKLIDQKISEIVAIIAQKTEILTSLKNQTASLSQEIKNADDAMHQIHLELADKEAVLKNSQANFAKINDELSLLEFESNDIEESIKKLISRQETARGELELLTQESHQQEELLQTAQHDIGIFAKSRETALVDLIQIKTELTSVQAKKIDIESTLDMIQKTLSAVKETLASQESEKNACASKITELHNETKHCGELNAKLDIKVKEDKAKLEAKEKELAEQESVLQKIVEHEQQQHTVIAETKDQLHEFQMKIQENIFKTNQIKERMLQAYHFDLDAAVTEPAPIPTSEQTTVELTLETKEVLPVQSDMVVEKSNETAPAEEIPLNLEEARQNIELLREKIDNFGNVNLVAIEELEELKQRSEFLEQQQQDLVTARESLNEAILKINRTTRKMFLDTFQKVAIEFKNYFKLLFGGGDAELFLLDEEDVLESGIEIACRPPGKKLQNILLLSGGEKTLSAIALIFAVFKTKPAPFCVLDEIDAALDEANVDRYSRMLEDFAKLSQFIVITHNKKTIAHSDVMYGITMEQSGVSKIVSVKLSERRQKPPTDIAPAVPATQN